MRFDIIDTSAGAQVIATMNTVDEVVKYLYDKSSTAQTEYTDPIEWYITEYHKSWLFMDSALKWKKVNFIADNSTEYRDLPIYQVLMGWIKV